LTLKKGPVLLSAYGFAFMRKEEYGQMIFKIGYQNLGNKPI